MKIFQATNTWSLKQSSVFLKKLTAGDLKVGEHFEVRQLSEEPAVQNEFRKFLRSLQPVVPLEKDDKSTIHTQLLVVSGNILESMSMLKSRHKGELAKIMHILNKI